MEYRAVAAGIAFAGMVGAGAVQSTETVAYNYNARSRLIKIEHSGTVNNKAKVEYGRGKADNRTKVRVNGASS